MKSKVAKMLAAIALVIAGASSFGCPWWIGDEPKAIKSFND